MLIQLLLMCADMANNTHTFPNIHTYISFTHVSVHACAFLGPFPRVYVCVDMHLTSNLMSPLSFLIKLQHPFFWNP